MHLAIGIVRYTAGVLNWSKKELKKMDTKTRKSMTMHGAFHRKSSVDRFYMKRKDGGRSLLSVFDFFFFLINHPGPPLS